MTACTLDCSTDSSSGARCPLCGRNDLHDVFPLATMPVVCNQLWPDARSARAAPTCDIQLAVCGSCTLLANRTFVDDSITYAPGYENALHYSPYFRAFANSLCADLVARHELRGRDVVEIGCGDGHILELMVQHGVQSGTGFDPSATMNGTRFVDTPGVRIVPELFRAEHLDRSFDFLLCRHVLEHLADPLSVLREVRAALGERDCPVYFEVPNALLMLDQCRVWDVLYEHVTYWTPTSIEVLFRRSGFTPVAIRTCYDDQFLTVEAKPTAPEPNFLPGDSARLETVRACSRFATTASSELQKWRKRLDALDTSARRAAIWGAGTKGITFANAVGANNPCLVAMIDINPQKYGRYVPGAALPVLAPSDVARISPDFVLISNELYAKEIIQTLAEQGIFPEFDVIAC